MKTTNIVGIWVAPLLSLFLSSCAAFEPGDPAVSAQRPSLSSDTATTAEGTLEMEVGTVVDPDDVLDVQTFLKWGIGARSELFAGASPYVTVSRRGSDAEGTTDLQVGMRHRFVEEAGSMPSLAIQLVTKLPTASRSEGLSSGETDYFAAGIATKQVGPVTATAFYQLGVIGRPAAGTDLQHAFAVAGAACPTQRVGVFLELAGIRSHDRHREEFFATLGASYAIYKDLVLDVGFLAGLDDDAPDFQILFGVTTNMGRPTNLFHTAARTP